MVDRVADVSEHKLSMEEFRANSYLDAGNAAYVEQLYDDYLQGIALEPHWVEYFQSLGGKAGQSAELSHEQIRDQFRQLAKQPRGGAVVSSANANQQEAVDMLISAYRRFGHLNAKIDPLGHVAPTDERLTLAYHQLGDADLDQVFNTRDLLPQPEASLREILDTLQQIYTHTVGVEYSRISDEKERAWLQEYTEKTLTMITFSKEEQQKMMKELVAADGMEKYLDVKYPGQKRFSIEGTDALIPLLQELSQRARGEGVCEFVVAMAHRGRLNVLMNFMGQSSAELFQEFDGTKDYGLTTGDVKYHRGFSSDVMTPHGPIHLSLGFNPSHLEFISPVEMGSVRARQEREGGERKHDYSMVVMIHGDGAFSGQGVVLETLNMSQTRAYHIGGSIHVITNNQVGFTTSDPRDARSSHYCSDVARMIDAPIFHVNADDVEAVVKVARLALDYRMTFHKDIVIDLVGYRRHGHQEADEPRATQPMMYKIINKHPTPKAIYAEQLIKAGVCSEQEIDQWSEAYRDRLDQGRKVVDTLQEGLSQHYTANWTPYMGETWEAKVDTTAPKAKILELGRKMVTLPENFKLQRNVQMIVDARRKMNEGERPLDWGYAETMAYATLLDEGYTVRLSGEDCRRGTFFHRHAALFNQEDGECYMPLLHLSEHQGNLQIYDSLLSETGPLGFEYGYSTADPQALTLWEAQFGDFANGAQVIIDQFISSGWQKWNRLSGLVMLLPHGYEGMGPEHSSARLERYLQLCAQQNMQVCVPTTPAQIFHLLRRQLLRPYRRPLIVMSPKSLLRHKLATSTLDDLSHGQLQLIISEIDDINPDKVRRVVLCSGKVYYELLTERRERHIDDIAIVRIEQLYPFPYDELTAELQRYPNVKEVVWCQEEPKNQGAWFSTRHRLARCLPEGVSALSYAGRHAMAAPAGGYLALHRKLQAQLVNDALS